MTIALVLLLAAATIWLTAHAVSPFARAPDDQARYDVLGDELRLLDELTIEKEHQLAALRELASDRATDKISEADYAQMKRRYERRAVDLMRSIDELHGGRDWKLRLDRALTEELDADEALPNPAIAGASLPPASEAEAASVAEPSAAEPSAADACAGCARPLRPDDRFCARCGSARATAARPIESDPDPVHETATA